MTLLIRVLAVCLPGIILTGAVLQTVVDPRLLFLDPLVAAEVSGDCCRTYYGIISTLGVMMWVATATACLFSAMVLRRLGAPERLIRFALLAGSISGWLAFDDAFLFHENIAPKLGLPQTGVLAFYVLVAMAYCIGHVREIFQADSVIFGLAGTFLATSVGLDVVLHSTDSGIVSLEDGAKFIGIACWMAFHLTAMSSLLRRQFSKHSSRPDAAPDGGKVLRNHEVTA